MSYFYAYNSATNNLKWRPRLKIYKSGSIQYDPATGEAWSYNWCFVCRINGKTVFNDFRYSNTTTRHQWEIRGLLKQLGVKIDLTVNCRESLRRPEAGQCALDSALRSAILDKAPMEYPRNVARVFRLPFNQKLVNQTIENLEIEACEAYLERAFKYQEDKIKGLLERLGAPRYYPEFNQPAETATAAPTSEVFPWAA